MDDSDCLDESVVIEFSENNNPVEVKTRADVNLPLSLTGRAAIWVNLTGPEINTYHLNSLSQNQEFPVIEYIHNEWYYIY